MAGTYRLQIVTQTGVKFDDQVESLSAPGAEGSFGVRPRHAAMIADLTVGPVRVRQPGNVSKVFACSGGILEVSPAGTVILADAAEVSEEIDVERARQAEERARKRLAERQKPEVDASRAEAALARAVNRLKTAQH